MSYSTPSPAGYGTPPYNQMSQFMMGSAGGGPPPPPSAQSYGSMPSYNQHGPHGPGGGQMPNAASPYNDQHGYLAKEGGSFVGSQQMHGRPGGGSVNFPGVGQMGQSAGYHHHHGFFNSHSPGQPASGPGSPYHSYGNTPIRHPSPPAVAAGGRHSDMKSTGSGAMGYGYPPQSGGGTPASYGYNGFSGSGNAASPHPDGATGLRPNSPLSPHQNAAMYNMPSHVSHQQQLMVNHQQKSSEMMDGAPSEQQPFSPHQGGPHLTPQNASPYDFYDSGGAKNENKSPHSSDSTRVVGGEFSDTAATQNQQRNQQQQPSESPSDRQQTNFHTNLAQQEDNLTSQSTNDGNIGTDSPVKHEQQTTKVPGEFSLIKHDTDTNNDNNSSSICGGITVGSSNNNSETKDKIKMDDTTDNTRTSSVVKNEQQHLMGNLDSIPELPEIPELKFSDNFQEVGKEEPPHPQHEGSQNNHPHGPHHGQQECSNTFDNQQQYTISQQNKSSITPPLGSDQSGSNQQHQQTLLVPKNDYEDSSLGGPGYVGVEGSNCGDMNRDNNSTMPPLVAMEGMQANQEAEFMSMNMSAAQQQHQQSMPPSGSSGSGAHDEGGKTSETIICSTTIIFWPFFPDP